MSIKSICSKYFNGFSIINDKKSSAKEKTLAKICIASYFLVLPPLIFGIGYALSNLSKSGKKPNPNLNPNPTPTKTQEKVTKTFNKEKINSNPQKSEELKIYPEASDKVKQGFFVDVLNKNGYAINGKNVLIPPAGKPEKFARPEMPFKEALDNLRKVHQISDKVTVKFQFKDRSTEQAISESANVAIALNFANEHHAGGGPGFHKDKETNLFVYDMPSAKAQEESLCQRSNLMGSLTQLPHTLKADYPGSNFIRSYYSDEFDSMKMAYISLNHLFAVQNQGFYQSRYLEEPKAVVFVTSAAEYHGGVVTLDCSKDSNVYKNAKQRIETHLLAAASSAGVSKMKNPDKPVELILGAFGCGAFAPQGNPNEYRKMIATIYKELLPEFQGFFDVVTFAVPTFGDNNPLSPAVANHKVFNEVLGF